MPIRETLEKLASIGPRPPGSEADAQTTELIGTQLAEAGRKVTSDEIWVRPDHHVSAAICAALAVAGSVVSTRVPPFGLIVLLVVTTAFYLDITGRLYSFRYLLPRRRTRNLTARGPNEDARARVVITAHHDSGRTGILEGRFGTRLPGALGRMTGPVDAVFWLVATALVLSAIRLLVGGSGLLTALQFVLAILLLLGVLALLDAAFSDHSPGVNDNASGVVAALELGRRLDEDPPKDLDVWLVFPAAKEGLMLGMRAWLAKRESLLKRKTTFFINLDTVGSGSVRYVTVEGMSAAYEHNPELIELCDRVATQHEARPHIWRLATDGVPPAMKGHPSVTICCLDEADRVPNFHTPADTLEGVDTDSIAGAVDFAQSLVHAMDGALLPAGSAEPSKSRKRKGRRKKSAKDAA